MWNLFHSGLQPTFFSHSLSAYPPDILESQSGGNVHYELETGDVNDDALYIDDLNEVACTNDNLCNKRISTAGQEWSAGRPGNRPIGAKTATHNSEMCLGPYATRNAVQPHTGHNTYEVETSIIKKTPTSEDQSTSQPTCKLSEEDLRPLKIVHRQRRWLLHSCRPPLLCTNGLKTRMSMYGRPSLFARLEAVQGEPSM